MNASITCVGTKTPMGFMGYRIERKLEEKEMKGILYVWKEKEE